MDLSRAHGCSLHRSPGGSGGKGRPFLIRQADHEFARGAYELAALQYAKTQRSLEEVALKFMHAGQRPVT